MKKDVTYLSEIVEALKYYNGMASLKEINKYIENKGKLPSIYNNEKWKNQVSKDLQLHCSETKTFKGAVDIFYSVYGVGSGYWGLRNYQNNESYEINSIESRKIFEVKQDEKLSETEKESLILARRGQGIFRERIIKKYNHCLISNIDDSRLLIASHIKPWRDSNNKERLSENNGLLLTPLYDKLFDIGLMSFTEDTRLIFSSQLSLENFNRLYINKDKHYILNPSSEILSNLEYHRKHIFKP